VVIEPAKATKWLQLGAQPSEAVHRLLAKQGLMAPPPPRVFRPKAEPDPEGAVPEGAK